MTHDNNARSNASYVAHVELIARAEGAGARLARSVKCADLADRMLKPATRPDGWTPPYELGLEILHTASSRPGRLFAVAPDTEVHGREGGSP